MADTRSVITEPRLSQGVVRKLDVLEAAIKAQRDSGVLDPDELLRLASDVRREAAEPNFLQQAKRIAGAIHAHTPIAPTGMING